MQQFCKFKEKFRRKCTQVFVGNTRSSEMITTMHGLIAKACIVLIISEDIEFWTRSWPHFLGLKFDKMASNQMKPFLGVAAL
jgi:hypothetical protein